MTVPGPSVKPSPLVTRVSLGTLVPSVLRSQPIRTGLVVLYGLATCLLIAYTAMVLVPYGDWGVWAQVPDRLANGTLYEHSGTYTWAWSPIAAWLIAVVVLPMGPWLWGALHFAALPFLRERSLILLAASSFPFWLDTLMANTFTFSAVSGYVAWRGNRWAAVAYLALVVLMPRPVQLPLAALLLWRDRWLWLPFAAMVAVGLVTTLASGYTADWTRVLMGIGAEYPSPEFNLSPSRILGPAWLLAGVPLAAWLTWRGRPGWAGLAMSPYLVPQYLLILLLDARPALRRRPWLPQRAHREPSEVVKDRSRQYGQP
jgi:hypothetical protein